MRSYSQVNRPLRTKEEQETARRVTLFWDEYDGLRDSQLASQSVEDFRRVSGVISDKDWRDRRRVLSQQRQDFFDFAMKTAGITEEQLRGERPISTTDQAIRDMFGVDIAKFTDPTTGDVQWKRYFGEQDAQLAQHDPLTRSKAKEWLLHNTTDLERQYKSGYDRGFGGWFDKDEAVAWYANRFPGSSAALQRALETTQVAQAEVSQLKARRFAGGAVSVAQIRRTQGRATSALLDRAQERFRQDLLRRNGDDLREWLFYFFGSEQ